MANAILLLYKNSFKSLLKSSSLFKSHSLIKSSSLFVFTSFHSPPLQNASLTQFNEIRPVGSAMWHHNYCRPYCSASKTATTTKVEQPKVESESSQGQKEGDSNSSNNNNSEQQQQGKSVRGGPVSWLSFLFLVVTGAGIVYYYDWEKKRHIQEINAASTAVKQGPSAGKAAIGGPFNLVDHNGKAVTDRDFKGKWTVIYFGFTHCPDICPDELQKLAAAVDKIKNKSSIEIIPIFISVDPERDNVEQVHEYVKEFHPALIGLTGTTDEVKKVARAFRVYYMKTEEEGSDYLVDHSIVMYLMDPNMEFVKFYGKNNDVDMLTDGIINEIKQYKKPKA